MDDPWAGASRLPSRVVARERESERECVIERERERVAEASEAQRTPWHLLPEPIAPLRPGAGLRFRGLTAESKITVGFCPRTWLVSGQTLY